MGKSNRSKAVNYRPVSLTCICCKVMEHIICSNLMSHLDRHNILTDFQFGFRKKRSCETQLLITVDQLAKTLDDGKQTDCILLDFSKAFDKVSHSRLLLKLAHYGVQGQTLRWVEAFLRNRTQEVVVRGERSDTIPVTSGVPQGTVLGPALFLVYINDLPEWVGSTPRMFADDCLLYREVNSRQDALMLQEDLNKLQKWEKTWLMEFAEEKCSVIRVTKKNQRNIIRYDYTIHGHTLQVEHEGKYLGVILHEKLSFNSHINNIIKKAANARQFLQRNLRGCSREVKETGYVTFVRPILEYSSTVWDPVGHVTNQRRLEAEQNRAARFVVGDFRRTTSMSGIIHELKWESLAERRAKAKATMAYRIVNGLVFTPTQFLNQSSTPSRTRGALYKLQIPQSRTNLYGSNFVVSASFLWNSLPAAMTQASSLEVFKNQVSKVCLG